MADLSESYIGKLWDTGNAITAFSVVQSIAFAIAVSSKDLGALFANGANVGWAIRIVVGYSAIYGLAVAACALGQIKLLPHVSAGDAASVLWNTFVWAAAARIFTVAAFGILSILAVWRHAPA